MAKEAVENPGTADTPVDLDQLKAALGCPLCGDMYRFPVTVMECLHTFCHECIVKVVQPGKGSNACPKCKIKLGNNPFVEKKIVRDGTKTSIVDKLRAAGVLVGEGGEGDEGGGDGESAPTRAEPEEVPAGPPASVPEEVPAGPPASAPEEVAAPAGDAAGTEAAVAGAGAGQPGGDPMVQ